MDPVPDPEDGFRQTFPATAARIAAELDEVRSTVLRLWAEADALRQSGEAVGVDLAPLETVAERFAFLAGVIDAQQRARVDGGELSDADLTELIFRLGLDEPPESMN